MALCPDVIHRIYSFLDYPTICYLLKAKICRDLGSLLLPHLGVIKLGKLAKVSVLIRFFPKGCQWPLLEGFLVIDVPITEVPWASIRFTSLTIHLVKNLHEPWRLVPLFAYAASNPCTKLVVGDEFGVVGEACDGYVSNFLFFAGELGEWGNFELRTSKALWKTSEDPYRVVFSYITHVRYTDNLHLRALHHTFPNLEYMQSSVTMYISPLDWPKLVEMGPRVLLYPKVSTTKNLQSHLALRIINVNVHSRKEFLEAIFLLPYQVRLSAEEALLPFYQEKYKSHPKVLEILPL